MQGLKKSIAEGNCLLNLSARSMEETLRKATAFLVQTGRLREEEKKRIVEGLLERERIIPTAIGHATAVPHFYDDSIEEPFVMFIRLKRPANFGAPDGVATRFIFLLLGPTDRAVEHLDALASIARLMSDDEFHYEAIHANTQPEILEALEHHVAKMQMEQVSKPREVTAGLQSRARLFDGMIRDVRRRLPQYVQDFREGFKRKCIASVLFLFFACLAPAITFGGIMGANTGQEIGTVEMLVASAICGILYALLAGQPLIILGGIGPLLIFTIILYNLCDTLGLQDKFLSVYGWVGLWTAAFTVLLAVTNASNLMRYFTRFTDEIFSVLMSFIFIQKAIEEVVKIFQKSFEQDVVNTTASHDTAFLSLLLALGTYYIAITLSRFRRSHYLLPWMREFLADFGPSIALLAMTLIAYSLRGEVYLKTLEVHGGLDTTSGRPWLVDFSAAPVWVRFAAAGPAILATVLVFLAQNITARLVNSPQNKLQHCESYHWDLGVVGVMIGGCSFFGFPWLCAATVRSLAHVRALADTEEVVTSSGTSQERIIHVAENRVTALVIHLLIAGVLFYLEVLHYMPMAALYGIFLYMGVVSLYNVQFVERMSLWLMDSSLYPATHYIRRVPTRIVHSFTLVQFACLLTLCLINIVPFEYVRISFPIFITLLVPIRWFMDRKFEEQHLAILDADEDPEQEGAHWF